MDDIRTTFLKLTRHCYITGLLFIAIGLWVLRIPGESYLNLVLLFSLSFLISEIFEIFHSVINLDIIHSWGWNLAGGIVSPIIGLLLLSIPEVSLVVFPFYVGFWLLFRSILAISISIGFKVSEYLTGAVRLFWEYCFPLSCCGILSLQVWASFSGHV